MAAVVELIPGSRLTTAVCTALEVSRASVHRHRRAVMNPLCAVKQRPSSVRALLESERVQVLAHLRLPRFVDQTPTDTNGELCPKVDGAAKSDGLSFGCVEFQVCGGL